MTNFRAKSRIGRSRRRRGWVSKRLVPNALANAHAQPVSKERARKRESSPSPRKMTVAGLPSKCGSSSTAARLQRLRPDRPAACPSAEHPSIAARAFRLCVQAGADAGRFRHIGRVHRLRAAQRNGPNASGHESGHDGGQQSNRRNAQPQWCARRRPADSQSHLRNVVSQVVARIILRP